MKKHIYALLILLFAFNGWGASAAFIGGGAVVASSGAFEGNVLHETFDSAGYDDANWTETGSAMDEDSTTNPPVGNDTGFSGQSLEYNDAWADSYATWADGTDRAIVYGRFYFYIKDAANLADSACKIFFEVVDSNGLTGVLRLQLCRDVSSNLFFKQSSSIDYNSSTISEDTSYKIEIKYDNTNNIREVKYNGTVIGTNTDNITYDFSGTQIGWQTGATSTINIFFDTLDIDTNGYPTD